jgi:anthranilate synthase component 2
MLLLIDNYDSFTYNLVQYLGELGAPTEVYRNDEISVEKAISKRPDAYVISPGPCDPDRAGICLDFVRRLAGATPLLGVCLGHQTIGQAYGGKIVRAPTCMHGKVSKIRHAGQSVFAGLEDGFEATRYHSLIVDRPSLPDCLTITAETDDHLIMGVQHKEHPVYGVQFHPESIGTDCGKLLLKNFLTLVHTGQPMAPAA